MQQIFQFTEYLQNKSILSKIKFYQGDILNDKYFENIKFDAIIANGILEHVVDPQKFILKMREKLVKKGMLFINVPNEFNIIQNEYMKLNSIKKKNKSAMVFTTSSFELFFKRVFN